MSFKTILTIAIVGLMAVPIEVTIDWIAAKINAERNQRPSGWRVVGGKNGTFLTPWFGHWYSDLWDTEAEAQAALESMEWRPSVKPPLVHWPEAI